MLNRRRLLQTGAAAAAWLATGRLGARAADTPGVSASEIRIGQTMPYSGPASAYGVIGKVEAAYFRMVNEQGGVNGRKIMFISLDDGYSPPRTVEQTRRLVEQEDVAFIFNSLGVAPSLAVRDYLNERKVPQLFVASGASAFCDPDHYPWTLGLQPNYQTEARIFAEHILSAKPDAKIALLYQNDDFGRDYLIGLKTGLGGARAGQLVATASYETSEPTVDSQVATLQGARADAFVLAATPKFAAQAIRRSFDLGGSAARYVADVSASIGSVMKAAGFDKAKGVLTANYRKDASDSRWRDDPGLQRWREFAQARLSAADFIDSNAIYGFDAAALMVHVLVACGDDLSRAHILKQALSLNDVELSMMLPGVKLNTSATNYSPIRQMQLQRFNGQSWDLIGELMSG